MVASPWASSNLTNPMEKTKMSLQYSSAARMTDPNQKPKRESDSKRKPCNRQTANSSASASRLSTPRDKKSGNDETKQNVSKKRRLICFRCGGKGRPVRL